MPDILIYADPGDIDHKFPEELPPGHTPYWSVSGTPRQTKPGCDVLFTDGDRVFARGEIVAVEDGRLWFEGLDRVNEAVPAEPVTRGFKYVTES